MSPTPDEKRAALDEVLQTPTFVRAGQLQSFLRLICEREIAGRASEINEYLIGVQVLGRAEGYSPAEDSVVRRRAVDLREKLASVYAGELASARVRIELPKGRYVPRFVKSEPAEVPVPGAVVAPPVAAPAPVPPRRPWLALATSFFAGAAAATLVFLTVLRRPSTPRPSETGATYEAEAKDNTLAGAVVREPCEMCSGGQRARRIGNQPANALVVNGVRAPRSGRYVLDVHYLLVGDRTLFASVNGGPAVEMPLTGTSWVKPAVASLTVPLQAGDNSIRLYNDAAYAPDLDCIVVRPAD
jgi:hypothetical protein